MQNLNTNHIGELDYLDEEARVLSKEELKLLLIDYHSDDIDLMNKAFQEIVSNNIPLVKKIVREYNFPTHMYKDIVQSGVVGLCLAIPKFNPDKSSFAYYATYWIKSEILNLFYNQNSILNIPQGKSRIVIEFNKRYSDKLPDNDEELLEFVKEKGTTLKTLTKAYNASAKLIYLDQVCYDDDSSMTYNDILSSDDTLQDEICHNKELRLEINKMLASISEKDRLIVLRKFGFDGNGEETYTNIAKDIGVTRQRTEQLLKKTFTFIKKRTPLCYFNDYTSFR